MIVPNNVCRKIERYFYDYQDLIELIGIEESDIIYGTKEGYQDGGRSNAVTKTTEQRAIKLIERGEKKKEEIEWLSIIKATLDHFKNTEYEKFINMNYIQQLRKIKIMRELAIENTTFYKRREDVVTYAYCKAIERGIITL